MRRFAALLSLALLAGCSSRQHLNPFDPANPGTGGRPAGFVAIAGEHLVELRWQAASSAGLAGFQLFRLAPGDSGYRPWSGLLPPTRTSILDVGLLDGQEVRYRLYFVLARGLGAYAEDAATPGPLVPWIADYGNGTLVRLSADGRHIASTLQSPAVSFPFAVAVSRLDGTVWAVGSDAGVMVYDPDSSTQRVLDAQITEPLSVAVSPRDGSAWVGDDATQAVYHLLATGESATPPGIAGAPGAIGIAIDGADGSVWVVEQDANRVRRYDANGTLAATATVVRPSRVAVDTLTHEGWVTSFSGHAVVRLSPLGARLDSITSLAGPIGIAVDGTRGRIWVADTQGDAVLAFTRSGTQQFRVLRLPEAREVAVDERSGEAWVTLTAAGAVARLSPAGQLLLETGGMGGPWGLALFDAGAPPVGPAPAVPRSAGQAARARP